MNTKFYYGDSAFPIVLLFVALVILACDVTSLLSNTAPNSAPTQVPVAQVTQPPPSQPTTPPQQTAPTIPPPGAKPKIASPDELNSYRMKMIMRSKDEPKGESVWTIEAVKNPPAQHIVMGNIEIITIGNLSWTKIGGKWIQQPPPQQTSAGGLSADMLKQLEEKYALQEIGRETVNGIPCRRYTYQAEVTISAPSNVGFKGEMILRAQGETWVADQPGLPSVAIRERGDVEIKSNVAPGGTRPAATAMTFSIERELYDINTPITIKPPEGVVIPPTGPTIVGVKPSPTAKPTVSGKPTTIVPQPTLAAGTSLFADEFSSATLNPKWNWEDRWQDATYDLKARAGFLRITAPTGNDLAPWTNFDAPYLIQSADGNWIAETAVEFSPTEQFQGAGILVYQDDDNLVRLERCFGGIGGGENGIHFSVIRDGEFEVIVTAEQAPTNAKKVELRLQREGNRYTAWWREPGKAWQTIGNTEITLPQTVQAGIIVIAAEPAPDATADFDYFRISRPK
ncbi:hypothetical protein ANRL1_02829 [Anaerolineae bacterium]|nr:hypothetical protein ANRL1_02829 [Anaerolineae bacterium]